MMTSCVSQNKADKERLNVNMFHLYQYLLMCLKNFIFICKLTHISSLHLYKYTNMYIYIRTHIICKYRSSSIRYLLTESPQTFEYIEQMPPHLKVYIPVSEIRRVTHTYNSHIVQYQTTVRKNVLMLIIMIMGYLYTSWCEPQWQWLWHDTPAVPCPQQFKRENECLSF